MSAAVHELRTDPVPFQDVANGTKLAEVRFNDRNFAAGDILWLRETVMTGEEMKRTRAKVLFTGRELKKRITHILSGYGLAEGWVSLSFVDTQAPPSSVDVAVVPRTPPVGLLISRAIRRDHGLGQRGFYDDPALVAAGGATHLMRMESATRSMRQVHEEVVGRGYYSAQRDAEYVALADGAVLDFTC
jgi:hypothetical protein